MSTSAGVFVPPRPGDDASHAGEGTLVTRLRAAAPWWALPTTVVVVLGGFIVYSMWTATKGTGVPQAADGHQVAPYLSPFYSPEWLVGHFPFFTAAWALVPSNPGITGTCSANDFASPSSTRVQRTPPAGCR